MKKLLLMMVCLAGLAYFGVGVNATQTTATVDRTEMDRDSIFPVIWISYEGQNGIWLNVAGAEKGVYVEIGGDITGLCYVPLGETRQKLLGNENVTLYIVRWYYE